MDRKIIIEKLKLYKENSEYKDRIKEIGLFGSYANDKNNKKSDVDVFIKLEPARMFDLIRIKTDLEKLLHRKIDIVTLRPTMNRYLKNQIKQSGIYV